MALTTIALAPPAAGQSLGNRLTKRLDGPPLDRHHWGVAVLDSTGRLLFGRNADRLFVPASNTKLVVTAAAMALLGPDATISTPVYAAGPVTEGGILAGDLVLAGRGDPTWARRCYVLDSLAPGGCRTDPFEPFGAVAAELKRRGIRTIAGAVVGDGSDFEPTLIHPTWENDDLVFGYAAPVSALGFNENTIVATTTPGPLGAPAMIELWPDLGDLVVANRVVTVPDTGRTLVRWRPAPEGVGIVAEGTIRQSERPERDLLAAPDPNRFAALALARVLADSGITVLGGAVGTTDSLPWRAARAGAPVTEIVSRPVADWVFPILNVSQNWVAEMLLKQLGRRFAGDGSWRAGIAVERRFLIDSVGIDSTQIVLHDGSGLSAKNAITPLAFARLLGYARRQPWYPAYVAGMPRSGSAGSLRTRFLTTPLAARVIAKTGSIAQVNSLSGFVADSAGTAACRIFSVQTNNHALGGRTMIQAIDSVVVEIGRRTRCAERRR